ncbi:hypothetical protein HYX06_04915 [Candidatus Woesearchaeota archaeon]|nr:hypothetical protein [Candidatus Woesearchaeota archaeon]
MFLEIIDFMDRLKARIWRFLPEEKKFLHKIYSKFIDDHANLWLEVENLDLARLRYILFVIIKIFYEEHKHLHDVSQIDQQEFNRRVRELIANPDALMQQARAAQIKEIEDMGLERWFNAFRKDIEKINEIIQKYEQAQAIQLPQYTEDKNSYLKRVKLKVLELYWDQIESDFSNGITPDKAIDIIEPNSKRLSLIYDCMEISYQTRSYKEEAAKGYPAYGRLRSMYPMIHRILQTYPNSEVQRFFKKTSDELPHDLNLMGTRIKKDYDFFIAVVEPYIQSIENHLRNEIEQPQHRGMISKISGLVGLAVALNKLEVYIERLIEMIAKAKKGLHNLSNANKNLEDLEDDVISEHIRFRESILVGITTSKEFINRQVVESTIGINLPSPHEEHEIIYAALLLAPKISTSEFVRRIEFGIYTLPQNLQRTKDGYFAESELYLIVKNVIYSQLKSNDLYHQFKIMEVGGNNALRMLQTFGAVSLKPADAGHSGYQGPLNYHAGSREEMIELSNYRKYAQPHSADLICSSRLFDLGSGIHVIAEPLHGEDVDILGREEMTLVMCNIVKDGGFMVHYDARPPKDLSKSLGLKQLHLCVSDREVMPGPYILRFHLNERKAPVTIRLGKKIAEWNPEIKTYERVK